MNITYTGLLERGALVEAARADGLVVRGPDGVLRLRHGGQPRDVVRAKIDRLGRWMLSLHGALDLEVAHEFADGMYMRKLFIPAGTLLVGKVHKVQCINIVASGDIAVLTEFGSKRLEAGFTGVSEPGIQKVGLTYADTVFVNVFRTDCCDVAEVEAEIATESRDAICL